ncbi:chaperone modulator CbpM [soil metagenome]
MENKELVSADEFCIYHQIDISFVNSLHEFGLIQGTIVETKLFLPAVELGQIEKFARLYYELEINLEGIDTISQLLQRMEEMQKRIRQLHERLSLYE